MPRRRDSGEKVPQSGGGGGMRVFSLAGTLASDGVETMVRSSWIQEQVNAPPSHPPPLTFELQEPLARARRCSSPAVDTAAWQ